MSEKCSGRFWLTLESSYSVSIPERVKSLVQLGGYANPVSFQRLTDESLDEIEAWLRRNGEESFEFRPGDRELLLGLAERVRKYSQVFRKLLNY